MRRTHAAEPADVHRTQDRPQRHVVAVVLAAGQGDRFGERTKQLEELDGRPLVAHAVEAALAAGLRHVIVVVGHDAEHVAHAARAAAGHAPDVRSGAPPGAAGPQLWIVRNPEHAAGQSTSLVAGIRAAQDLEVAQAALILLADQPRVDPAAVRAVAAAVEDGAAAARARYLDGPSHPVAFGRLSWDRLLQVTGDQGAREVLRELPVVEVPVDTPAPRDVDTPEDLDALRAVDQPRPTLEPPPGMDGPP